MDSTYDRVQAGWSAYGRDDEKIGDIEEVGPNYLLVTKGLIFPKDLYVPLSAVRTVEDAEGRVILDVEKAQVDGMAWDRPPGSIDDTQPAGPGAYGVGSHDDTPGDDRPAPAGDRPAPGASA